MLHRRPAHRRTTTHRRADRRRRAFTMIEMLLVLAIIGIMAAAIAPTLSELLADRRHGAAPRDLVRLAQVAAAKAKREDRAQLLRIITNHPQTNDRLGVAEIWPGMRHQCDTTPWPALMQDRQPWPDPNVTRVAGSTGTFMLVVDGLNMQLDYNPYNGTDPASFDDEGRHVIWFDIVRFDLQADGSESNPVAVNEAWLCYQPNGRVFVADTDNATLRPHDQEYQVTFLRRVGPTGTADIGVRRRVLFRPGAAPRVR